jgi:Flp pilus assembly protein TadG
LEKVSMMASGTQKIKIARGASRRAGSVTVEMAIIAPILVLLLFGTVEMGLLFKDSLTLDQACREAVRVAAVGDTTSDITTRAEAAAPTLNSAKITVTQQYRTYSSGTWSAWTTLGNNTGDTANNAPSGSQIEISLSYPHTMITGGFFSSIVTPGTNTCTIKSSMVMMHE